MLGAIIGDIVGSIYEFDNIKTKEFEFFHEDCDFTDDTVMTVAVGQALLECSKDDYEIEIDPIAESCMVAGVASWIAIDNPEIYDVLNAEYNNLLANLSQIPETVNEHSNGITRIGGWYW